MHLPRVWAEIDLEQVAANLQQCRRLLSPHCSILGVVKGEAYGHGAVAVASVLERNGIGMLGVGDSHEAIRLREGGISSPILVLGAVVDGEIPELIRHGITPMVHSPERIQDFDRAARRIRERMPVHLLVDTGMSRLGVPPARALDRLHAILRAPNLALAGLGTHLASPAEDPDYTRAQIARFQAVVESARAARIHIPLLHAASSLALARYPEAHFNMVRVGGILYGLMPDPQPEGVRPALSLYTQIVYLRDHATGTSIGYGGTYRTRRRSRIATLPVGYHDGYAHRLSNRAQVLVRGRRAPVVGRVTMDYLMVDVTEIPGASVGDRVTLIGHEGSERVTAEELARHAETTIYEIPTLLGNRVRRFQRFPAAPPVVAERRATETAVELAVPGER